MRNRQPEAASSPEPPAFYSVAEAAKACRVSEMTLYRAIQAGEFPAVRIRGRIIVPGQVLRAMALAAMDGGIVDAADWAGPHQGHGAGSPGALPRQPHRETSDVTS
jgi:excisionase family DNA binding protein